MEIRRELAAAYPDRYRPDLASSLSNLGVLFSALGRPAEALPVTQEAVEIRRELAAANPDRYRPDLASSLTNLGSCSRRWAVPARPCRPRRRWRLRELATVYPDRYRPDLATSLSNLGTRFTELGRPAEALPATEEAVEIRRELAAAYPDRYRPDLAASLSNLGTFLGAGPSGRGSAGDPGGGRDPAGAGRRLPRPVPARPGRSLQVHARALELEGHNAEADAARQEAGRHK